MNEQSFSLPHFCGMCQGGKDALLCLRSMLKIMIHLWYIWTTCNILMTSHLIFVTQRTVIERPSYIPCKICGGQSVAGTEFYPSTLGYPYQLYCTYAWYSSFIHLPATLYKSLQLSGLLNELPLPHLPLLLQLDNPCVTASFGGCVWNQDWDCIEVCCIAMYFFYVWSVKYWLLHSRTGICWCSPDTAHPPLLVVVI